MIAEVSCVKFHKLLKFKKSYIVILHNINSPIYLSIYLSIYLGSKATRTHTEAKFSKKMDDMHKN